MKIIIFTTIILKKSLQNRALKEITPCLPKKILLPSMQEDFSLYGNELLEKKRPPFLENRDPLQDKIIQITRLIFPPKVVHHVYKKYPCSFVYVILFINIFGDLHRFHFNTNISLNKQFFYSEILSHI